MADNDFLKTQVMSAQQHIRTKDLEIHILHIQIRELPVKGHQANANMTM